MEDHVRSKPKGALESKLRTRRLNHPTEENTCGLRTDSYGGHKSSSAEVQLLPEGAEEPSVHEDSELENCNLGASVDTVKLTKGVYSKPSKYERDQLVNFWCSGIYECLVCSARPSRKFNSHNAWQQHIKYSHNVTKPEYRLKFGNPDITGYKHSCYICQKTLSHSQGIIKKHLITHSMSLEDYMGKYRDSLLEEKMRRPMVPSPHLLEGWWEGCMYSCKHCNYTVPGAQSLEHHLTLVHKMLVASLKEEYGELCTLVRFHRCCICARIVKHEYKSLYTHLSVLHKMDLNKYLAKFLPEVKEELRRKGMEYVIEKDEDLAKTPSLEQYLSWRRAEDEVADTAEDRVMKDWADYCEYRCHLCQEVALSNLKFHLHIVRQHKVKNMLEYRQKHGNPEIKHRLHKCLLCENNITWEASRIRDHLKSFHKEAGKPLTLKEYGDRFKDEILLQFKKIEVSSAELDTTRPPHRFGSSVLGGSKKEYSHAEWKQFFHRKYNPKSKVLCPECNVSINRSSLSRHMMRNHPFSEFNEEREMWKQNKNGDNLPKNGYPTKQSKDDQLSSCKEGSSEDEYNEAVYEEVVLEDASSSRFMINQVSGEILLLEDSTYSKHEIAGNVSLIICDNSSSDLNPSRVDTLKEDENTETVPLPEPSDDSEPGSESELETGPLDGRFVEINSPTLQDPSAAGGFQFEFINVSCAPVKMETDEAAEPTNEPPGVDDLDKEVLEAEIIEQTIYIDQDGKQSFIEKGEGKMEEQTEPVPLFEKNESNIFLHDSGLESIILSNVDGVQQIAVVRRKGATQQRFDKKMLMRHISSILNVDQKIFDENAGPLKILEIEVDSHTEEPRVEVTKESRVAEAYALKIISSSARHPNNRISIGTQASRWTKMADERNKISRHKCFKPRPYQQEGSFEPGEKVSDTVEFEGYLTGGFHYSSRGTQVNHDVSRGLWNEEEEEEMKERIISYIQAGKTLERTCPGCNKVLAKPKNLMNHLETQHCVRLAGSVGEALHLKKMMDNAATSCPLCQIQISRKSLRRHLRLKHNQK